MIELNTYLYGPFSRSVIYKVTEVFSNTGKVRVTSVGDDPISFIVTLHDNQDIIPDEEVMLMKLAGTL